MCVLQPVGAAGKQNINPWYQEMQVGFWEKLILAACGLLPPSLLFPHLPQPLVLAWGTAESQAELPLWGSGTMDRYSQKATQALHYLLEHFVKTKNSRDSGVGGSLEKKSKYGQCQNRHLRYLNSGHRKTSIF